MKPPPIDRAFIWHPRDAPIPKGWRIADQAACHHHRHAILLQQEDAMPTTTKPRKTAMGAAARKDLFASLRDYVKNAPTHYPLTADERLMVAYLQRAIDTAPKMIAAVAERRDWVTVVLSAAQVSLCADMITSIRSGAHRASPRRGKK